jgi:hypothetical protein
MDNRVISTLKYLHSLLDIGDDEAIISVRTDRVTVSFMSDILNVKDVIIDGTNPIQAILAHISEQMCTDCLSIEYLYKDDFFINLVKGYIECLVHEFGRNIPITPVLANAITKHKLCTYTVAKDSEGGWWLLI